MENANWTIVALAFFAFMAISMTVDGCSLSSRDCYRMCGERAPVRYHSRTLSEAAQCVCTESQPDAGN